MHVLLLLYKGGSGPLPNIVIRLLSVIATTYSPHSFLNSFARFAMSTAFNLAAPLPLRSSVSPLTQVHRVSQPLSPTMPLACTPLPTKPVPDVARKSHITTLDEYHTLYTESVRDPAAFWTDVARTFTWQGGDHHAPVLQHNFRPGEAGGVFVKFMDGRKTNICYNALDRWVDAGHGDRVAFYCEGNERGRRTKVTYTEMLDMVERFARALQNRLGVRKGDIVVLYMPMIPELPAAMLACARIGAVHSVVFAGFSADALAGRILDCKAEVVVVAESVYRGKKLVPLKEIADKAIEIAMNKGHAVRHQVVAARPGSDGISGRMVEGRDLEWSKVLESGNGDVPVEWVESEHPLFVLYTSGSTGKPKGVVQSTGGYMVYAATTFKYSFDYHEGDVFFSTSDCGWITGHSYVTYGPMLNGAMQVLYEGVPNYPDAGRLWDIVQTYGVNQLYTAPTVIRALKGAAPPQNEENGKEMTSNDWVAMWDTSSLRVLGTVGEPINPEAWMWYYEVVGRNKCAIVDTWWQTETGGHAITPLPIPGLALKPGSAMMPFFGIQPAILSAEGEELEGPAEGFLVIKAPWPSTLRTVYGDHSRMEETYFTRFPGYYMTGDGARRDNDGHYWLTGRVDDILNVSGHRIGTAEVESALVTHEAVAEAAVVGVPHPVKGEGLYAYVSLMSGVAPSEDLRKAIRTCVRTEIGPFAAPDTIHWASALPKTRSGKIMRRILRKIAANGHTTSTDELGDTSTLTDPGVIDALLETFGK